MNDLEQIKEILFGNEKKALNALLRRLETPESRTADVADVLPDAVTRSYKRDPRLGKALSLPVETTLSNAIRREPKKFADALFPIMGPAIRKSISEALKSMLQSMNNAIDTSLSPSARFRAWRAGVPLAEWVLRENLVYRVDEVYLVDPQSGLLINHLHHPDVTHKDEDAISAMLTAIQDFVRDSFTKGSSGGLDSAVIGDYTVWISQGPHAMLACVIRGMPPAKLKSEIAAINERVHLRHSQALLDFQGEPGSIDGLDMELEELLRIQRRESAQEGKGSLLSPPLLLALVALLAIAGFFLIRGWITDDKMAELEGLIQSSPGLISTNIFREGALINIAGLRDPLASDPVELARQVGINPDKLTLNFQPFQSLDTAIVEQRARQILQIPEGVILRMQDDTLVAEGHASATWREKLMALAPVIGGISNIDASGLREDDKSLEMKLRQMLSPDERIEISVTKGVAIFSGIAPLAWHDQLGKAQELVPGVIDINKTNLKVAERVEIQELHAQLDGQTLYYSTVTRPTPGQDVKLINLARMIRSFRTLAQSLNQPADIRILGHTDGTGASTLNTVLKVRRANDFRERLVRLGVDPAWISVESAVVTPDEEVNPQLRKAVLKLPALQK